MMTMLEERRKKMALVMGKDIADEGGKDVENVDDQREDENETHGDKITTKTMMIRMSTTVKDYYY